MSEIPATRYVKSDDVHIAYQVLGKGPLDILFVPGFVSHLEAVWPPPEASAVHVGARVAALAPSEVLVSQTVRDLVAGSGLMFESSGIHSLKGVPGEWHLYRAAME
jgi:hypothetical protein